MLQLLSPAGLWAFAALSLPLAIHLWRPPPRTVRLGSLRFLENLPRRLHDLRWRERLLLAARLALLAFLALGLAAPRWRRRPPHAPQRWVLLDPDAAPAGESLARLRALQSAGAETHLLAPGFPATLETPPATAPDLWSLLREADAGLPPASTLTVFSPGRLASLRGSRPRLTRSRVDWITTPEKLPLPTPGVPPVPPPPRVLIRHDADHAADARSLTAALRAANIPSGPANPDLANPPASDWLFWLSAQPVPPALAGRIPDVFSEVPSSGDGSNPTASWIVPVASVSPPVRLWRRTPPPDGPPGAVYWTDGFGQPLLTAAREGRGLRWRFYGRFDPAWTDLPLGSAFPASLRALVLPRDAPARDRRLADPSQCHPSDASPAAAGVTLPRAGDNAVDLHMPLWTLAAAFFVLERLWSLGRRPSAAAAR